MNDAIVGAGENSVFIQADEFDTTERVKSRRGRAPDHFAAPVEEWVGDVDLRGLELDASSSVASIKSEFDALISALSTARFAVGGETSTKKGSARALVSALRTVAATLAKHQSRLDEKAQAARKKTVARAAKFGKARGGLALSPRQQASLTRLRNDTAVVTTLVDECVLLLAKLEECGPADSNAIDLSAVPFPLSPAWDALVSQPSNPSARSSVSALTALIESCQAYAHQVYTAALRTPASHVLMFYAVDQTTGMRVPVGIFPVRGITEKQEIVLMDKLVETWELQRQIVLGPLRPRFVVRAAPRKLQALVMSSGCFAYTSDDDGSLQKWDFGTDFETATLVSNVKVAPFSIHKLALSPDGDDSTLSWIEDGDVKVLAEGNVLAYNTHRATCIALSHGGEILASGSDNTTINTIFIGSGQYRVLRGHLAAVNVVTFSPMGKEVLISGSDDGTLRLWDVTAGTSLHVIEHNGPVQCAVVSGGGLIAASSGTQLWLWRSPHTASAEPWPPPQRAWVAEAPSVISALAFIPNGTRLLEGTREHGVFTVRSRDGVAVGQLRLDGCRVLSVAAASNGVVAVATAADGKLHVWDAHSSAASIQGFIQDGAKHGLTQKGKDRPLTASQLVREVRARVKKCKRADLPEALTACMLVDAIPHRGQPTSRSRTRSVLLSRGDDDIEKRLMRKFESTPRAQSVPVPLIFGIASRRARLLVAFRWACSSDEFSDEELRRIVERFMYEQQIRLLQASGVDLQTSYYVAEESEVRLSSVALLFPRRPHALTPPPRPTQLTGRTMVHQQCMPHKLKISATELRRDELTFLDCDLLLAIAAKHGLWDVSACIVLLRHSAHRTAAITDIRTTRKPKQGRLTERDPGAPPV